MKKRNPSSLFLLIFPLSMVMLLYCNNSNTSGENINSNSNQTAVNLYDQLCATCHGTDQRGGNAQSLFDGIWQYGAEYNYIYRNIKFGIPHLGMPSYENALSDEELRALTDYILGNQTDSKSAKKELQDTFETMDYLMHSEIWLDNLDRPWGIKVIDQKTAFVTEKGGKLLMVKNDGDKVVSIEGIPEVLDEGQGGLMDVNTDKNYQENGWIYISYSHALDNYEGDRSPAMTRIIRGKIDGNRWTNQQVLFEAPHETYKTTRHHYGNRIVFDPEGYLYFSIGDRGDRPQAQLLDKPNGKIHRINPDGTIPNDNPFTNNPNAMPSIFTYGNRNPQGLSVHPATGEVWEAEHGPLGGDELNLIKKGINYGWPEISYGKHYSGEVLTPFTHKPGMEQPILYWKPSIAVCGIEFYTGNEFPKWQNKLLVGALKYEEVRLLQIEEDRVVHEEIILKNQGRVRDVGIGPDGAIYVVLNKPDRILRLTKKQEK